MKLNINKKKKANKKIEYKYQILKKWMKRKNPCSKIKNNLEIYFKKKTLIKNLKNF